MIRMGAILILAATLLSGCSTDGTAPVRETRFIQPATSTAPAIPVAAGGGLPAAWRTPGVATPHAPVWEHSRYADDEEFGCNCR